MFNWSSLMFRLTDRTCHVYQELLDVQADRPAISTLVFRMSDIFLFKDPWCLDWSAQIYQDLLNVKPDGAAYHLYLKLPDVQTDRHTVHIPRRWTWNIKDKVLQRDWNVFQKMAKFCVKAPFFGTSSHLVDKMLKIWHSVPLSKRITHSNDRVWYRVSHIPCLIG